MAVVTQRLGGFLNETVVFSFDWDNATGDVLAVRCVNGSASSAWASIVGTGNGPAGRSRTGTFAPGTTVINIPTGQRPRYPVVVTDGVADIDGYTAQIRVPA